jgi:large subunit ribosomal protein L9
MKVILLQNIKGFGKIGEVKSVSDGHARNFLFPRKLAKVADASGLKEVESLQKKREAMDLKDLENTQKVITMLASISIEFQKKASPTGTLFSSVTKNEIAHELTKKTGVKIDSDMIHISEQGEHLKHIGEHVITVDLGDGQKAEARAIVKSG